MVEYNTIACGMMSLSERTSQIHEYLLEKYAENHLESNFLDVKNGQKFDHFIKLDEDRELIEPYNFTKNEYVKRQS